MTNDLINFDIDKDHRFYSIQYKKFNTKNNNQNIRNSEK